MLQMAELGFHFDPFLRCQLIRVFRKNKQRKQEKNSVNILRLHLAPAGQLGETIPPGRL